MSPAAFAVGQRRALEQLLHRLQQLDPGARLYSYLDDTYLAVRPDLGARALAGLRQLLAPLGLELNDNKTLVWSPAGIQAVLPELAPRYVAVLPVLGAQLRAPGDPDGAALPLGGQGCGLDGATTRLGRLWASLERLLQAGLKRQAAAALLNTYAGNASQHHLQLALASAEETFRYDAALRGCWESLLRRPLGQEACELLGLPAKLGGAGAQWAATRRAAACWAAWTQAAAEVQHDLGVSGVSTLGDMLAALPLAAAALEATRAELARQGADPEPAAPLEALLGHPTKQKTLVAMVHKRTHAAAKQRMHHCSQAALLSAGGPGAGAYLRYPTELACTLEDPHWQTATRSRVQLPRPECAADELARAATTCQNLAAGGAPCQAPLDAAGYHATICQPGGGVVKRHGGVARAAGSLAGRWSHSTPLYEQRVPTWDRARRPRPGQDAVLERAILDVEYDDTDGRRWLDVTVRHPAAGDEPAVRAAARRPGEAARRAERAKHARYPGERLTAFAVETGGRLGGEARAWLLSHVRELPEDAQPAELARAYQVLSCALQRQLAQQLRRAAGLR